MEMECIWDNKHIVHIFAPQICHWHVAGYKGLIKMAYSLHMNYRLLRKIGAVMCTMSYSGMVLTPIEALANNSAHNPPPYCSQ